MSILEEDFFCVEECSLKLAGFGHKIRADVLAVPRYVNDRWVFACEVKIPVSDVGVQKLD